MTVIVGILGIVAAGALSYAYLTFNLGPRTVVQAPIAATSTIERQLAVPVSSGSKGTTTKVSAPAKANASLVPETAVVKNAVITPGPLRASTVAPTTSSDLTIAGVILDTNNARAENGGLPALTENALLDQDAHMKLNDMFAKQYFEHVSPTGVGPADLAKAVGYGYVVVGENLALGDFGSDQGVVTAWMNSPGHRANILNVHYQEIGVAVGKGMYEGHDTWLAVQSFGMPLSACPAIDANLKAKIADNNATIASMKAQLDAKKAQIDATPTSDPNYNTYVNQFNAMIPDYNNLIETNRFNVTTYNGEVQAFNSCIASVNTSTSTVAH